jgi:hypothetical protein
MWVETDPQKTIKNGGSTMSGKHRLVGALLGVVVALSLVTQAFAAPLSDPLVGTIDSITEDTSVSPSIIVVKYTDGDGMQHTVNLSLDEAANLGLVTLDQNGALVTIDAVAGDSIDLTGATFEEVDVCAGDGNAVASALCDFFSSSLGVDAATIQGWHDDGFGYGLIAQALFAAQKLGGDMALADEILQAKKSGDYSGLGLPDDVNITNWGQFRKYVMSGEDKSMTNLGAVMSGRAEPALTTTTTTTTTQLHGNGHGQGGTHGKGGDHGKGKGKGGGH